VTDLPIHAIEKRALNIRKSIIRMVANAGSGHLAGPLGLADIFAALYLDIMKINPDDPNDPDRDILVLSNGHVVPAQYAAMAEAGLIPKKELMTLRKLGSRLEGHPEREKLPWCETTSGPLGEGLSQAAGMAYAIKNWNQQKDRWVYCLTGDGELNEGNNWEAMMFAAKNRLNNLIAVVDRNYIQIEGNTEDVMPLEPLDAKFKSFGWRVIKIDGNDVDEFIDACEKARTESDCPIVILARVIPGKGVSFMENDHLWHGKIPNPEETKKALLQLETKKYE